MIGAQVPRLPGASQASHCPSHARSQQTPSKQTPFEHSSVTVQVAPGSFLHVPVAHVSSPAQPTAPQQAPSTQWPLVQERSVRHFAPSPSIAWQVPLLQ